MLRFMPTNPAQQMATMLWNVIPFTLVFFNVNAPITVTSSGYFNISPLGWSVYQAYNSVRIWAFWKTKRRKSVKSSPHLLLLLFLLRLLLQRLGSNRHISCSPHLGWHIVVCGELTDFQEWSVSISLPRNRGPNLDKCTETTAVRVSSNDPSG